MIAHRYRPYPWGEQQAVLEGHCRDARTVWNAALEQFNHWRPGRSESPGRSERDRQLAEARQAFNWLRDGSSSVQQQALRDFDQALGSWWSGTHRRPTWRRRGLHEGFCVRDVTVYKLSRRWAELMIPKAGRVRFRLSRSLPAERLRMARVTLDGKRRWHVSFPAQEPTVVRQRTGALVGVDRGVRNTLATSNGRMLRAPVIRNRERRRLKRLQQRLARQRKGSQRRARTKRRIARLHQTVRDRRRNWIEIQTTRLVRDHDLIAVEDLHVKRMVRRPQPKPDPEAPGAFLANGAAAKRGLNRSIHAQGWSRWLSRLRDKAQASGVHVVAVDPRHTSQQCRACGHTAAQNRESQAVFCCESCGHQAHADRNAAENILARALQLAPTPGPGASKPNRPAARVRRHPGAAGTTHGSSPKRPEPERESHGSQPWEEVKSR